MVTSLLIGFVCIFFILGHSTLLFFKSKDFSIMPLRELLLPWPKNGRFVSLLCLCLSAMSLFALIVIPSDLHASSPFAWKILSALTLFPSFIYGNYIFKRLHKNDGAIVFCPSDARRDEWGGPLIVAVIISLLFLIL